MLKPVMFKMLEIHYKGEKAIFCIIPDSLSTPGIIYPFDGI